VTFDMAEKLTVASCQPSQSNGWSCWS
jgi:hypothetical protein